MGLAKVYPCTEFEVSSFTRSKDTAHVSLNGWMREGCAQTRAWISVVFTKSGINIVEWSVLYANVLDFRYVFALSNYALPLIVCDLARKMVQILGFSAPVRFRGHFDKIAIAKVLLNTKLRRVGKFRGCRFSDVWESVAGEKK